MITSPILSSLPTETASGKDVVFGPVGTPGAHRVASITHDILGDPFWAVYRGGLRDAAERFGCVVHHRAPQQFSPTKMAALIEQVRRERPDGMLVTVPDAEVVDGPLRAAIADGIPVIAINAADPRPHPERIPYLFYIGAEDVAGGRLAAERLLEAGEAHRALAVDHYLVDNACHSARCTGFLETLAAAGVPGERLRVPGNDPSGSAVLIADHLRKHEDVDVVLTLGPPGCRSVIEALAATGRSDACRHASFDLAVDQLEGVAAGRLSFTIDSQQYLQGFLGVSFLDLHLRHGFVAAADVHTGPAVIDASNAERALAGVRAGVR
jgi:simple sugar transport system substrate-binding protein